MSDDSVIILVKVNRSQETSFTLNFKLFLKENFVAFSQRIAAKVELKKFSLSYIDNKEWIEIRDEEDFDIYKEEMKTIYNGGSKGNLTVSFVIEKTKETAKAPKNVTFSENPGPKEHVNIVCDGCEGPVRGFRYKCLQCGDYDLCMICEGKSMHQDHLMVRIPSAPATALPRTLDRVLNLGSIFEIPTRRCGEEEKKKCRREEKEMEKEKHKEEKEKHKEEKEKRKEEKDWRKEEGIWNREEEKWRRYCEKVHKREEKTERRRCHRGPPHAREFPVGEAARGSNPGFLYHALDFLNYMMNPDNIMATHPRPSPTSPEAPSTSQEKTQAPAATDKAQEAREKSQEEPLSFLQPNIVTAVGLGTDANSMTTSFGVPATDDSEEANKRAAETAAKLMETIKENLSQKLAEVQVPKVLETPVPVETVESMQQKLNKKLDEVERSLRSRSPTLSLASNDSEGSRENEKEWTVLDNDEEDNEGAVGGGKKQDKATSTDSETSSVSGGAQKKAPEISFEQLGRDLKAHIEKSSSLRGLSIPTSSYPHPAPTAPVTHHSKPHIHHAIETMLGMGFSNEGGWLTSLVESVDGNIPRALDLLQPHK